MDRPRILPFRADEYPRRLIEGVAKKLRPLGGIIVFLYKDGRHYWWSCYDSIYEFGAERVVEDPQTYCRLSAAVRKLDEVRREKPGFSAGLALWIHPDAGVPLDKYLRMSGPGFPGCPTQ